MPIEILKSSCTATPLYVTIWDVAMRGETLGENMAHINYVEFHNFEVDCSEISGDATDISVIMQNSDVSILDLCEIEFGSYCNETERDELADYLNGLIDNQTVMMSTTVKNWIEGCEDFEILLELMSTVTTKLFRVAQSRGQL